MIVFTIGRIAHASYQDPAKQNRSFFYVQKAKTALLPSDYLISPLRRLHHMRPLHDSLLCFTWWLLDVRQGNHTWKRQLDHWAASKVSVLKTRTRDERAHCSGTQTEAACFPLARPGKEALPLPDSLVPAVGENTQNGEIKLLASFWKQGMSPLQGQEGYSWVLFL